jgi:hypothetical protein
MSCFRLMKAFVVIIFCILIMHNSHAGEVKNLYETSVVVNNEVEKANRQALLNKAFIKVLLKVTGSREFLKLPESNKIINQSESLVQKFSFSSLVDNNKLAVQQPPQAVAEQATVAEQAKQSEEKLNPPESKENNVTADNIENKQQANIEEKTLFWARFSKQSTNQLLKKIHLPVWERLGPETLLW